MKAQTQIDQFEPAQNDAIDWPEVFRAAVRNQLYRTLAHQLPEETGNLVDPYDYQQTIIENLTDGALKCFFLYEKNVSDLLLGDNKLDTFKHLPIYQSMLCSPEIPANTVRVYLSPEKNAPYPTSYYRFIQRQLMNAISNAIRSTI